MKHKFLVSMLLVFFVMGLRQNSFAMDIRPYISGAVDRSLESSSVDLGGHFKAGLLFGSFWGVEIGYYALGGHTYKTSDYDSLFDVSGYSLGVRANPFVNFSWEIQPYVSLAGYMSRSYVRDLNGLYLLKEGDTWGVFSIGVERTIMGSFSAFAEVSSMAEHKLLGSFPILGVGVRYQFGGNSTSFDVKEKSEGSYIKKNSNSGDLAGKPVSLAGFEETSKVGENTEALNYDSLNVTEEVASVNLDLEGKNEVANNLKEFSDLSTNLEDEKCHEDQNRCLSGTGVWLQMAVFYKENADTFAALLDDMGITYRRFDRLYKGEPAVSFVNGPYDSFESQDIIDVVSKLRKIGIYDAYLIDYR